MYLASYPFQGTINRKRYPKGRKIKKRQKSSENLVILEKMENPGIEKRIRTVREMMASSGCLVNDLFAEIEKWEQAVGLFSVFEINNGTATLSITNYASDPKETMKAVSINIKQYVDNSSLDRLGIVTEQLKELAYKNVYNIPIRESEVSKRLLGEVSEEDFMKAKIKYYLAGNYVSFVQSLKINSLNELSTETLKETYEVIKNEFKKQSI